MAATVARVRGIAPEFRDTGKYPDQKIQDALDQAARHVNATSWGDSYEDGVAYYAAHVLAISNPQASQRPVRVYETPGAQDIGPLGQTVYGQEFARMRQELLLGALVA